MLKTVHIDAGALGRCSTRFWASLRFAACRQCDPRRPCWTKRYHSVTFSRVCPNVRCSACMIFTSAVNTFVYVRVDWRYPPGDFTSNDVGILKVVIADDKNTLLHRICANSTHSARFGSILHITPFFFKNNSTTLCPSICFLQTKNLLFATLVFTVVSYAPQLTVVFIVMCSSEPVFRSFPV